MEVVQITDKTAQQLRNLKNRLKEEEGKSFAYSDIISVALDMLEEKYSSGEEGKLEVLIKLEKVKRERLAGWKRFKEKS